MSYLKNSDYSNPSLDGRPQHTSIIKWVNQAYKALRSNKVHILLILFKTVYLITWWRYDWLSISLSQFANRYKLKLIMHLWASFFTKLIKDENNIHYHKWTAIANWLIIDKAKIKSKKPTFQTTTIGAFSTKMICFHIPGLDFSEFHGDRHRHCCSSNSTICRQSKHISGQKKQSLWCLFLIKTCFNRFVTIITMYYTDWCFATLGGATWCICTWL